MRLTLIVMTVSLFLLALAPVNATTWARTEVKDPIAEGNCDAHEPNSYGSYIYHWPSKYDGVYWPYTDADWIWFCPNSGYTSFGNDFDELKEEEKQRIGQYLKKNYSKSERTPSVGWRLKMMEEIYLLRDKDEQFWAWFYRVLAYWNRDSKATANAYRKKALPLIEKRMKQLENGPEKIQHLYLMGEYNRQLGNFTQARAFFKQAKSLRWKNQDGKKQTGHHYFNQLVEDMEKRLEEQIKSNSR